jgi:mannose-1-phosphate guanylyltransferase
VNAPSVYALVLAGGSGTRFWPASRAARPKQLLPLTGPEPLIRRTVLRVLPLVGDWSHVLVAAGTRVLGATREIVPEVAEPAMLIEPAARNTAPCIAWAAAVVARREPDAIVMVLPSDHHVADEDAFRQALSHAIESARGGAITTIGIRPTRPDTGFGYLEVEPGPGPVLRGVRFVEKPDREKAEAFLAGGRHLWNGGMFIFRARDMVDAVRSHAPEIASRVDELDVAAKAGNEAEVLARVFPTMPSISIDYAVMERLTSLAVVPGDFGWSDVGSWQAAYELAPKDADQNGAAPGAYYVDACGNLVVGASAKKAIVLLGVEDLVVVDTEDALLVVPRSRSQDVRAAVDLLSKARPGVV